MPPLFQKSDQTRLPVPLRAQEKYYVLNGKVTRQSLVRVVRDGIVVFDRKPEPLGEGEEYSNKIGSLQRFKDSVREVAEGYECGITLARYSDLKEGDILEIYTMEEVEK